MSVVAFIPRTAPSVRSWSSHELELLVSVYERHAERGDSSAWEVGATELDDPQFYVLGAEPDVECVLVISRVGRMYVLENGQGQVLADDPSLETVVARAAMQKSARGANVVVRLVLGIAALRAAAEERLEPILVESEELLVRVAPQLATLL